MDEVRGPLPNSGLRSCGFRKRTIIISVKSRVRYGKFKFVEINYEERLYQVGFTHQGLHGRGAPSATSSPRFDRRIMSAARVPEAALVVLDDGGDDFAFEDAASRRRRLPERRWRGRVLGYWARPLIGCRCLHCD